MSDLPSQHRRLLDIASRATFGVAIGWALYFAVVRDWALVGFDLVTALSSCLAYVLGRRGRARAGLFLSLATMYAATFLSAAFLDLPSARAARSMHEVFLPLGVGAMLTLRNEPAWLRQGFAAACFGAFAFFVGVNPAWHTGFEIADGVRVVGVWVDHAAALILLYAVVRIIQNDIVHRGGLEIELRDALLRDEFELFFQPQLDAAGRVFGAEALIRWRHPARGLVLPNDFIPLAESTGVMVAMGDWVLRSACGQLARWRGDPVLSGLQLSVNVSATQFEQPGFEQRVLDIVRDSGAPPARLTLELTESMLARDMDGLTSRMGRLKSAGIRFSLDDFGTGFSSLARLRELPFDELKIDRAFVRDMLASAKDAAIVGAVISLGNSLGLEVIAEGVETTEQRGFLVQAGCERYQGYLFCKPVPAAEFLALLARRATPDGGAARAVPSPTTRDFADV